MRRARGDPVLISGRSGETWGDIIMLGLNRSLTGVLALCCLGAATQAADAGLKVYNDQPSYLASTTGLSDVNFNGIVASGGFTDYIIPTGYTDPGTGTNFTFPSVPGGDINVTSATYYSVNFGAPVFPDDVLNSSSTIPAGAVESITLPGAETAVSLYFSTYDGAPITITLSNGASYTDTASPTFGNFAFLGFTDTSAFSSLTVSDPSSSGVLLADFTFGTAIPEPPTWVLLGFAALLLAGLRQSDAARAWLEAKG
jgi:hypothetical protein